MLASNRSEPRVGRRRRSAARSGNGANETSRTGDPTPWEQARAFSLSEPWDAQSAEALTRLYESEEGNLCKPADVRRTPPVHPAAANVSGEATDEGIDRNWLEAHLSQLAERLQDALACSSPEGSLAALNARLEVIEQRFSTALGRVARRADLDGLKSIEAQVLELAAKLERARDHLEQIGNVDDRVRTLEGRVDEAGEQRAAALEKLLRDCIAEWREGEQRTAGAIQNLEEVVNRLGDSIDAMEASKPALDLTVPTLVAPDAGERMTADGSLSHVHGSGGPPPDAHFYHARLDAADYAPRRERPQPSDPRAPSATAHEEQASRPDSVEWSPEPTFAPHAHAPKLTPGALRIKAVRAKLRQSAPSRRLAEPEGPPPGAMKRASYSLLLMAGAAIVAGSTYYLYQTFVAPSPLLGPMMMEWGAKPAGVKSDMADPNGPRVHGAGAG